MNKSVPDVDRTNDTVSCGFVFVTSSAREIRFGGRLLHVAPEACLEKKLRRYFDYMSIDQTQGHAMRVADITRLPFADNSFDAVICNHVLEHVEDDRTAIAELHRVLRLDGWASLLVPLRTDVVTDEDRSVVDPRERLQRFGQEDHVRLYGYDYFDRLRTAGFDVEFLTWERFLTPESAAKHRAEKDPVMMGWKRSNY